MTKIVRWGILSTAQIAQEELLPAFKHAKNANVTAIASANPKVSGIAEKFNIPVVYSTYEELLDDPDIDAVYIPLPNALHAEWVKKAAQKGKRVFCEKPGALTAAEAKEMIDVCKENNVMFLEAFMYQFHPQHQRVKEIVASGEIGEVKSMRVSLSFFLGDQGENIRMNQALGGGALYDVGCYCVHSIRNLLGAEPARVFVSTQNDANNQVDLSAAGILEFDNGMTAVFDTAMNRTRTGEYELIGTKGTIRVPRAYIPHMFNGEGHVIVTNESGDYRTEHLYGHQYTLEVESFSQWVLEGQQRESVMENTIHNMNVLDACFESVKQKTFVDVARLEG
ncbi:Gfo/Idh/MocA family protein [Domibacillus tundrae]|uniref:Gfo/Idh/MocA family protein n=1 Tax=Domibacillus tundrae TaxID=1587527 RepID=UPI000617E4B6|nr:Gfo/Idh/MocA family oxidoreductase [Domibacillus tundrae]